MIETTTRYIIASPYHTKQIHKPISKAFQSLSFRGKLGYPQKQMEKGRAKIYGGILRIKYSTGYKYALVQGRYTGKWSFPKGHSNKGEEPMECTQREVAEETGIDILPEPIEYLQIGYGHYYIFDLKEQLPLIPRDTNEIMDTKWVTIEEMEKMSLNADANHYLRQLRSVTVTP